MDATTELELAERIAARPDVCHGQPTIRGTRIMVWLVLEYLANGDSVDDVIAAYPELVEKDVRACLAYAARAARERVLPVEIEPHALQA